MALLQTSKTLIDTIEIEDAPFFVELLNSPGWLEFIGDRGVHTEADARRYLEDGFLLSYRTRCYGYYLIRIRTGEPIGICGFMQKPWLEHPDFGFAMLPQFSGQGLAFEACMVVLDYGDRKFRFEQLDALVAPTNERSIRLLERLAFELVGPIQSDLGEDLMCYTKSK